MPLWGEDERRGTIPGQVFWFGISEDGGQVVAAEGVFTMIWTEEPKEDGLGFHSVWSHPGTITGCNIHYRNLAAGVDMRAAIPTSDACSTFTRGKGTITPAPAFGGHTNP
ncbi:MAG: hypothetical protein Q8Q14_08240 [Gemmatimonadales bacterium]|nr:hypothetical protein [Gemmatimonadales bacterium]